MPEYIREVAAEVAPEDLGEDWFAEFLRYVAEQRRTKRGRFLRVHFRTGVRRDVVPEGSIASGRALERDEDGGTGWRFIHPDIEALRRELREGAEPLTTRSEEG